MRTLPNRVVFLAFLCGCAVALAPLLSSVSTRSPSCHASSESSIMGVVVGGTPDGDTYGVGDPEPCECHHRCRRHGCSWYNLGDMTIECQDPDPQTGGIDCSMAKDANGKYKPIKNSIVSAKCLAAKQVDLDAVEDEDPECQLTAATIEVSLNVCLFEDEMDYESMYCDQNPETQGKKHCKLGWYKNWKSKSIYDTDPNATDFELPGWSSQVALATDESTQCLQDPAKKPDGTNRADCGWDTNLKRDWDDAGPPLTDPDA